MQFLVVGVHLEVLVGNSALNSLQQNESKIKLCVIVDKSRAE
jgi:hypothetical protein